jgi:hypothetical protein
MDNASEMMLAKYFPSNVRERESAIKEIIQEIVLAGLSRGGFFDKAVFYGGSCLRIFYGLDRFSEDLDFALTAKEGDFKLEDYFPYVEKELLSYGLRMEVVKKAKRNEDDIESGFVKGKTRTLLFEFFSNIEDSKKIIGDKKIKIKFEIDLKDPPGGVSENKYRLLPSPYKLRVYDQSTLFSGKLHAIIVRQYKNRVKGRDYYDYLFYRAKDVKMNLKYLANKLKESGKYCLDETLDIGQVKSMLAKRFKEIDYKSAKDDVANFISDKSSLSL